MSKIWKLCAVLVSVTAFFATSVQAQMQYYYGGGIGYSNASSYSGGATSIGDLASIGLTFGARINPGLASGLFYGYEIDADINVAGVMESAGAACSSGASDAYFCSHDATGRFRGLVGTSLGGFEVFGTVGYAIMFGQGAVSGAGATDAGIVGGVTYSIGAQKAFGNGTVRLEVIRDDLTSIIKRPAGTYAPTWETTSVKISYLLSF
ncbi:MAG: hypothetical protein V3V13_00045 [Paracoccaceae bacterium]